MIAIVATVTSPHIECFRCSSEEDHYLMLGSSPKMWSKVSHCWNTRLGTIYEQTVTYHEGKPLVSFCECEFMVPIGWCTSVQFMINNLFVWAVMWNGPLFIFTIHWLNGTGIHFSWFNSYGWGVFVGGGFFIWRGMTFRYHKSTSDLPAFEVMSSVSGTTSHWQPNQARLGKKMRRFKSCFKSELSCIWWTI